MALVSRLTQYIHLCFGLLLFLLPGCTISRVFLPTYSWSRLFAWPNHLSLAFLHLSVMFSTFSFSLMSSFLTWSLLATCPSEHLHFCHFQFLHLGASDWHCLHLGVYCSMPSKQYLAAAHRTGGHSTRLEHHRRGRHVLLGAVVDQQVQTYLTKLLGCCQQCHCSGGCTWHPESHGGLHELGRGWAKSFMQRMGFVMRKVTKTVKKLPHIRRS